MAEEFDEWYADMAGSRRKDEIQRRHLGLPPDLLSTSLLTWDGLAQVAGWRDAEYAMWVEAAALDPGDDPALAALHEEGERVLDTFDRERRVMATARLPDGP